MTVKKKKGFFKLYSLQFVIAIACIAVSLLPMTYTGFSVYSKYADQLIDNSDVFTNQIMDQLKINIEAYVSNAIKLNDDVESMIRDNRGQLNTTLMDRLNVYYSSRNDLVSISIVDLSGEISMTIPQLHVKYTYDLRNEPWYTDLVTGKTLYGISEPHVQNMYEDEHEWVVTVARVIQTEENNKASDAILFIDVNLSALDELVKNLNLGGSGYIYLTNKDREIIYHPQQALVFSGYKEELSNVLSDGDNEKIKVNNEILTIYKSIDFVDWEITGVTYITDIYKGNQRIAREILAAVPLIMVIIIMLSWYISGRITLPIKKLEKEMQKVQKGDLEAQFDFDYGEKEVMELGKSFNTMIERISLLIDENKQEHEAKRISELNALQAQINPHFLYNTLDSIMWMAESGQNEEVVDMVTSLAKLFRISISKGKNVITVREEIEHARNYLLIQKIRYKDKFDYVIDVPEEMLELPVPKLILQPIIENSIYHGIEYMVDEGLITIRVSLTASDMILEVEDNGLGMDKSTIEKLLFRRDLEIESHKGSGVGVRNVDERIKLRYGENYGIAITSEIEEGTTVQIRVPRLGGEGDV